MSAIVKLGLKSSVAVAGIGLMCLTEGLKDLNLAYEREKELVDCDNEVKKVALLIKTLDGKEFGVIQTEEGFDFVTKDLNCAITQDAIKKIKQQYSKNVMINELKSKGYKKVKEEKLPNGKIRLVVEKWE